MVVKRFGQTVWGGKQRVARRKIFPSQARNPYICVEMQTNEGTRPMRATIRHRGVQRQDGRPVGPSCREGRLRSMLPENTGASTSSSHIRPFRQKGPTGDSGGRLQTTRPDVPTHASDTWPTLAIPPVARCTATETMEHAFSPRFFPNKNLLTVKKKPSIGTEKCLVNQTKSRFWATWAIPARKRSTAPPPTWPSPRRISRPPWSSISSMNWSGRRSTP